MLLAAHESQREILGYQSRFLLPTVAPGLNSGVLRIVSSVLHILPQTHYRALHQALQQALVIGRKAAQERFSEENFRSSSMTCLSYITGNAFLNRSTVRPRITPNNRCENVRHTTSFDELAEPNYYSNSLETSSTHLFASDRKKQNWSAKTSSQRRNTSACLLILSPASTLRVFHSIVVELGQTWCRIC